MESATELIGAIENDGWLEQNYWVSPLEDSMAEVCLLQSCPKVLLKQFLNKEHGNWMWILHCRVFFQQLQQRTKREIHYPSIEEYSATRKQFEEIADSLEDSE